VNDLCAAIIEIQPCDAKCFHFARTSDGVDAMVERQRERESETRITMQLLGESATLRLSEREKRGPFAVDD